MFLTLDQYLLRALCYTPDNIALDYRVLKYVAPSRFRTGIILISARFRKIPTMKKHLEKDKSNEFQTRLRLQFRDRKMPVFYNFDFRHKQ